MPPRSNLHVGDIFEVPLGEEKKFLQYLMNDSNLFDSQVIRVFDLSVPNNEELPLNQIVRTKVQFHTHTMIKGGVKLCGWRKIGNVPLESSFVPPGFRATDDGYANVKVSKKWYAWVASGELKNIGRLSGEYKDLDYGSVFHPIDVTNRIRTGVNEFLFPE